MTKSERSELVIRDYEFLRTIGKGSYGEVWLCKQKKDDRQYVVKKIDITKSRQAERDAALLECKLLSELKHPNIVPYKESFEHGGFLYIAMGYCEGGDLYTRLRLQNGRFLSERQLVEWFIQIAIALQHMHSRNILHRDLKTQNIFLTRTNIIKVGDLGIARVLETSNSMATTLIGTPYYMSPELFSNQPYNHKSDIWALGCVLYEMSTLKHAFNARNFNALSYKILSGRKPDMPKQYSPELLDIMRAMLHQKPEKRPSARRVLSNPFIRRHIVLFLESTKDASVKHNENISDEQSSSSSKLSEASSSTSSSHRKTKRNVIQLAPDKRPKPLNLNPMCKARPAHQPSPIIIKDSRPETASESMHTSTPNTAAAEVLIEVEPDSEIARPVPTIYQIIVPFPTESRAKPVLPIPSTKNYAPSAISELSAPRNENLEDKKALNSETSAIVVRGHTNWSQMDARQRRRERRRLGEHTVQHQGELNGSEVIRHIILRQRKQVESRDDLTAKPMQPIIDPVSTQLHQRPASHQSCLLAHARDSTTCFAQTDTIQKLASNDKVERHPAARVSDPFPKSNASLGPSVSASPDLGYVSITTSPSPSIWDRTDLIEVASDSAVGLTESSSCTSFTGNSASFSWNKHQSPSTPLLDVKRVPPPIMEQDKEIEGLVTCMTETLRLGDPIKPSVPSTSSDVTPDWTGPQSSSSHTSVPTRSLSVPEEPSPTTLPMAQVQTKQQLQQNGMNNSGNGPIEPYEETISRTARLKQRFTELHKECLREVGLSKLHRVYQVLESDLVSEKQEPILKEILGADHYARFMGKIWQLKLFEEHTFHI